MNDTVTPPEIEQQAPVLVEERAETDGDRARLEKLLSKQLRNFTTLLSKVLVDEDADAVHDLRVSTRRLQQILYGLAPAKNLNKARSVRRTLRCTRRALGPWRNCDVALQWIGRSELRSSHPERRRGWELVRQAVEGERKHAIKRARRRLVNSGGFTLTHGVRQLVTIHAPRLGIVDCGAAVAAAAVGWRDALARAMEDRSVQNVHALRIQMKRLRYRVELARDLGAEDARPLIRWFKSSQDRLGRWHDRHALSSFITDALASSRLLLAEPRVAVVLLKEVEKNIAVGSHEVEAFFRLATESEGRSRLDTWLKAYCQAAEESPSASSSAHGHAPGQVANSEQSADPQSTSPESAQEG